MLNRTRSLVRNVLSGGWGWACRSATYGIGVDLGSACSKIVVLKKHGRQWRLVEWAIVESAHELGGNTESPMVKAQPGSIQHQTRQVLKKHGCGRAFIGISVGGPRMIVKHLALPAMSEAEIREHVKWELDRYISTEMGEVLWDLHVPSRSPRPSGHQQQVMLVVAKKEYVEHTIRGFRDHGIHVGFVDAEAFALVNAVTFNYGHEKAWMVAHVGPSGLLFLLIQGGDVLGRHEVTFAAEWYGDFVDQLRTRHHVPFRDQQLGIPEKMLLEPFVEEIKGQIQDTIQQFGHLPACGALAGILLSGGYAAVEGLPSRLGPAFDCPVSFLEPCKNIQVPPAMAHDPEFSTAAPILGVALGVAIRGGV